MAQRRMYSKKIIDTDMFLDMSVASRELYFQLALRADDDGFIGNHKRIMRMIGASEDDIKVLIAKRFLIPFQSGVCVITHWHIHNYIQKDRYEETQFVEEKSTLKLCDNGEYSIDNNKCIQNVSKMDTQVRLGKVRLGKVRLEESEQSSQAFNTFWEEYPNKKDKKKSLILWNKLKPSKETIEKIMSSLKQQKKSKQWKEDNGKFIPHPSTWLNGERWTDVVKTKSALTSKYEIYDRN